MIDVRFAALYGLNPGIALRPRRVISVDFVMSLSVRYGSNFGPTVIGYEYRP